MTVLVRTWKLLVHNFWWRVLAVLIAVAIWGIVASEPELSTFETVPVEYRNLPDDLEMSSPPAESVTLELHGPSGELHGVGEGRSPAVVLDMTSMTPGLHTFNIGDGNVRLGRGVRLIRAIPSQVRFEFDRRVTRAIPVQVRFLGEAQSSYVVGHYAVVPDKLVIVGPSRHVELVRAALTDPVDVSTVVGTSNFHVAAFVDDSYVRFQSAPEVTVTVTMKRK